MKQLIKIYFSIAALSLLIFSSCETNKVTKISLDRAELSMLVGELDTLTADVDYSGNIVPSVSWTSSNTSVASVSNGAIKALKKGTTTITATTGEKSATCNITVTSELKPVFTKAEIEFWGDFYETGVSNNHLLILSNQRDTLYLEVNTALTGNTSIPNGVYKMLSDDFKDVSAFLPLTIVPAFESEGYSFGSWFFNDKSDHPLESGLLTVSKVEEIYTFVYDFVDYNNVTIMGTFSGSALFTDQSESDSENVAQNIKRKENRISKIHKFNRVRF